MAAMRKGECKGSVLVRGAGRGGADVSGVDPDTLSGEQVGGGVAAVRGGRVLTYGGGGR